MNISDSERIAAVFESMNIKPASAITEADFIIMNMCSVRQTAVDRVYGQNNNLRRLKRANKGLKTILTGCILDKDRFKMAQIFDYILDKKDLENWTNILTLKKSKKSGKDYLEIEPIHESKIQAFVPISNGCDNYCTYCAVPYTRGSLTCRDHKSILKEIEKLVKNGYKEIWLLGENVNSYTSPKNKEFNFVSLIKEINKIQGDFWVRFTSPHPKYFSDELIQTLAELEKFTPYLNLPVQSGDNSILRKMNRPYTREAYKKLVLKLRKAFKNKRTAMDQILAISTDVIIGFPTETEAQFKNTAKLMKEIGFDMAFISQYSPRPQSFCYKNLDDDVLKIDKRKRDKTLNEILKITALKNNQQFLNKTIPVLVFDKKDDYYFGRTRQNKPVRFRFDKEGLIGQFVNLKIKKVSAWSLEGEFVKPKLIVITGPTASGKTDLAIKLAKNFNGEIVSADSRLIYKGMDVGTSKPHALPRLRRTGIYCVDGIKHHLIDILEPNQKYNVALFKEQAIKAINETIEKGKTPFLVGGTGLYIKAIVDNLDFPRIEPDMRLRRELEKKNTDELFEIYQKLDPLGAEKIDKNNKRRLIRAIEVCKITGQPFWQERKTQEPIYEVLQLGLGSDKKELETRITKRVDRMIKVGLEKEVKNLLKKYSFNLGPMQTIGYQEWKDYLKGSASKTQVKEKIIQNTISYAKRQMTWFKKQSQIIWVKTQVQAISKIKQFLTK